MVHVTRLQRLERIAGEDSGDGVNTLPAGVVSDVSFVGVSTQYLVRMPWGQELTVFEQNAGARERFRSGDPVSLRRLADLELATVGLRTARRRD